MAINNEYFICSCNTNKIVFYNTKNYSYFKEINIDSLENKDSLLLFKEFIIVPCNKGIGIVLIKTKELIQYLENNYSVYDQAMQDGKTVDIKNEYLYKFGDILISRYKVLSNASILKDIYKVLDNDMLLTCICKDSFLEKDDIEQIKQSFGKGRK